jgi:hypothetical protein
LTQDEFGTLFAAAWVDSVRHGESLRRATSVCHPLAVVSGYPRNEVVPASAGFFDALALSTPLNRHLFPEEKTPILLNSPHRAVLIRIGKERDAGNVLAGISHPLHSSDRVYLDRVPSRRSLACLRFTKTRRST